MRLNETRRLEKNPLVMNIYGRIDLKGTTGFASCLTLESAMAAEPIQGCIFRPTHKQLLSLRDSHPERGHGIYYRVPGHACLPYVT
jgi:hypothetical protein